MSENYHINIFFMKLYNHMKMADLYRHMSIWKKKLSNSKSAFPVTVIEICFIPCSDVLKKYVVIIFFFFFARSEEWNSNQRYF